MVNLEAVDAKIERSRHQLRRLRSEAADFCRERSRLILPEQCEDRRLWVYRGGEAVLPSMSKRVLTVLVFSVLLLTATLQCSLLSSRLFPLLHPPISGAIPLHLTSIF